MLVRLSDTSNRHIWKHHAEYEVNLFSGYVWSGTSELVSTTIHHLQAADSYQ
jgi:hypothetical protein